MCTCIVGYEGYTSWGAGNYTPQNALDHLQREAFYGVVRLHVRFGGSS